MSIRNKWWKLKDVTRLPELKNQTREDHEVQDFCVVRRVPALTTILTRLKKALMDNGDQEYFII